MKKHRDEQLLAWEYFFTRKVREVYLRRKDFEMVNECERELTVIKRRWEELQKQPEEVLH